MALHLIKKPLPKLRSERLCVRLLEPHESAKMVQFRLDNRKHLEEWEPRRSPEFFTEGFWQIQLRISLRDFRDGATVNFVLLDAAEEEVLGVCNYTNIVRGTFQSCHLGYALHHKAQGTGTMHEALQMTNAYIFKEQGLHRIMAGYLPRNDRSGALLERLGFEKEGYARKYLKINGAWEDHILTALINED